MITTLTARQARYRFVLRLGIITCAAGHTHFTYAQTVSTAHSNRDGVQVSPTQAPGKNSVTTQTGSRAGIKSDAAVATELMPIQTDHQVAYAFDCSGRFIRIVLRSGETTSPKALPGVAAGTGGLDGCLINGMVNEPGSPIVFAVLPIQRYVNALGQRQDQLASFSLPELKMLGSVTMPPLTNRGAKLHLDSSNHTISIGYHSSTPQPGSPSQNLQYLVSVQHPEHLELMPISGGGGLSSGGTAHILSKRAYVDMSGLTVDGNHVISSNGVVSPINGSTFWDSSLTDRFQTLQRHQSFGNGRPDITFVDQAAGKMLFVVGWDMESNKSDAEGGLVVYDALAGKVLSSFAVPNRVAAYELTPDTPTVHLTPDGQRVILEDYQWVSGSNTVVSTQRRSKTGVLTSYDANSGTLLSTVSLEGVAGESGRVIGFSEDSTLLYYVSKQSLYVVGLSQGESRIIKMPQGFLPTEIFTTRQ